MHSPMQSNIAALSQILQRYNFFQVFVEILRMVIILVGGGVILAYINLKRFF